MKTEAFAEAKAFDFNIFGFAYMKRGGRHALLLRYFDGETPFKRLKTSPK